MKKYIAPVMELEAFVVADVITTSIGNEKNMVVSDKIEDEEL